MIGCWRQVSHMVPSCLMPIKIKMYADINTQIFTRIFTQIITNIIHLNITLGVGVGKNVLKNILINREKTFKISRKISREQIENILIKLQNKTLTALPFSWGGIYFSSSLLALTPKSKLKSTHRKMTPWSPHRWGRLQTLRNPERRSTYSPAEQLLPQKSQFYPHDVRKHDLSICPKIMQLS